MRRSDHLCTRLLDWSRTAGEDFRTFNDLVVDIGVHAVKFLTDERCNAREAWP